MEGWGLNCAILIGRHLTLVAMESDVFKLKVVSFEPKKIVASVDFPSIECD